MSLTDSEIMGGVGFGDEAYSYYNYAEDLSHLIHEGRRTTDPFDGMMSGEEISYLKHNPRIENSQYVYTNKSMRGRPESYGRDIVPEDLDNSDTVDRYLLNRLSGQRTFPMPSKFTPPEPNPGIGERFRGHIRKPMEYFEEKVQDALGENTISLLITIIFILIVALVVLQIINANRLQKLVRSILKNIPQPVFVSSHVVAEKNTEK